MKDAILIVVSTEGKLITGVIASAITGLLVAFHVVDPTQADTLSGTLQTGIGLVISLVAVAYGLESLLFKHKAEVSAKNLLDNAPAPVEPVAPVEAPAA